MEVKRHKEQNDKVQHTSNGRLGRENRKNGKK